MRKHISKALTLFPLSLFSLTALTGCGAKEEGERYVLRVLNSADYIYEEQEISEDERECGYASYLLQGSDKEDFDALKAEANPDMMDQFVDYMKENYDIEVSYVYDTFDTNETMYNELMTGKSNYDIICTSDYMLQKLISNDLIQPISKSGEYTESDELISIHDNVSDFLWNIFDGIHPKKLEVKDGEDPYIEDKILSQYSVPYMWGTVGIMYNPSFYGGEDDLESIINDFSSWDVLYKDANGNDTKYTNTFSVKDSVRDMYAVSIVHAFKEEIARLGEEGLSDDEYNKKLNAIFNRCDNETIEIVKEDLLKIKENSFGFEVDSGKTDMVEGKIGANISWSGDATWAIQEAASDYEKELYFSIPEEGSNIWFDGWCIPSVAKNPDLARYFIDFMAQPSQAIQNMWSVGYTSSTNGDEMLDYVYECYDVREEVNGSTEAEAAGEYEEYDISYFFNGSLSSEYEAIPNVSTLHAYEECVGRDLTAQYPEASILKSLCVMDDFGTQNTHVLNMWEHVRTNSLPVWAIILLVLEALLALSLVAYFVFNKVSKNKMRKVRRDQRHSN